LTGSWAVVWRFGAVDMIISFKVGCVTWVV
jgi:hypothetical protein